MAGAFSAIGQKEMSIAAVQGDKGASPVDGQIVRVSGVVTAILKKGFYIQTPDDQIDKDPKTSEGLYIYGENSVGSVSLGNLVQVEGTVTEFRPRTERIFLSITEITKPTVKVVSKDNPLPAPIVLTAADLDPKGKLDQMERFEGMRVTGDFVAVAPTGGFTNEKTGISGSNGVFFVVLQGTPRPFREPGLGILQILVDKLPNTVPAFDMNPELLRIDSSQQEGAKAIDVTAGATLKGMTGVIDYSRKFYTLYVDAANPPKVDNIRPFVPTSPAGEREATVGSFNIENFFDDETNSSNVEKEVVTPKDVFQKRLTKTSLAIRNVLSMPDVLGIVEVENIKALQKLADKVNADAVAANQPDPKYVAYLEEGNDVRGIDVGFLIKSTKIKVLEVQQLGRKEKLESVPGAEGQNLYDRPPLMLRAEVIDTRSAKPLAFTVIVNHFKSYNGIDDVKDGDRVRQKRRLEAEWLAKFVEDRQKADPTERIILCGDFNSFQFNDGYNDLIGILKGKSDQNVLVPSKTAYATGLVNLIDYIDAKNRYSYSFDGSAQSLDHILVNKPARLRAVKFGYARSNADFPKVYANDASRPERTSDHDAAILYLNLDEPAPVATPTPTPKP
ncbi:MAG: endonuclease/exonuclease/phosphatase family protein [Acidobacteria bacterium]|nr:endonuclease/exonuclease/phosphatase family protein [Acidobacteriota bacterium]MBK7932593.1 endonuclease/exonuclease/phosphatase family protein [Acidobacteriota bacterium]